MNQIERIVAALQEGGVDFDKKFPSLENLGYASDDCQTLSAQIVEDIEGLIIVAINNGGFKKCGKVRDAVSDLTVLAVKLSEEKAAAKLSKLKNLRQTILNGATVKEGRKEGMNLKEEAKKYLDTSVKAAQFMLDSGCDEDMKVCLEKSLELFQNIKEVVENAWDNVSKEAALRAGDMIDCIMEWRKKISVYACDRVSVGALERALECAKLWEKLRAAPKRGEVASQKDIEDNAKYFPDTVDRIIGSWESLENLNTFRKTLAHFNEDMDKAFNLSDKEAQLKEKRGQLESKQGEATTLAVAMESGEMSTDEVLYRLDKIEEESSYLKEDIADLEADLSEMREMRSTRETIAREFNRIGAKLDMYKHDPALLASMAERVDFVTLTQVLLGRGDSADIQTMTKDVLELFDYIKLQNDSLRDAKKDLVDLREQLRKERVDELKRATRVTAQTVTPVKTEEQKRAEALERLKKLGVKTTPTPATPTPATPNENTPVSIPLGDGDK